MTVKGKYIMDISKNNSLKLILLTPIFIWLTHYLAVFTHEYAHAFTAM